MEEQNALEDVAVATDMVKEEAPKKKRGCLKWGIIGGLLAALVIVVALVVVVATRSPLERIGFGSAMTYLNQDLTTTTRITMDLGDIDDLTEDLDDYGLASFETFIDYFSDMDRAFVVARKGMEEYYFEYQELYDEEVVLSERMWTDYQAYQLQYPNLSDQSYAVDMADYKQLYEMIRTYIKYVDFKDLYKTETYQVFMEEMASYTEQTATSVTLAFDEEDFFDVLEEVLDTMEDDQGLIEAIQDSVIQVSEAMLDDDYEIEIETIGIDWDENQWEDAIDFVEDDFEDQWEDAIEALYDEIFQDEDIEEILDLVSIDFEYVYNLSLFGRIQSVDSTIELDLDMLETDMSIESHVDYDYHYTSPKDTFEVNDFDRFDSAQDMSVVMDDLMDAYTDQEVVQDLMDEYHLDRDSIGSDTHMSLALVYGFVVLDMADGELNEDLYMSIIEQLVGTALYY